ncbi:antitoxin of toxin-antitoxin stability system [Nostoc sp. 3335mG]|nr:antitoxin of toxin-antitoxin stability system [Nostoc sp. 3335mG]
MPKPAMFTMKLEPDLRAAFMAAAQASHRPASQVVRELMRDFIRRQQEQAAHDAFVARKVAAARASVAAGRGLDDAAVEADFAARRAGVADDR